MTTKLTKEQLLAIGWTEDKIKCFAGKPHLLTSKKEPAWPKFLMKKIELFLSFQTFSTADDFYQRQQQVSVLLEEKTKIGIETIESLNVEFEEHNCLLKNIEKYDPMEPIFHQTMEDFKPIVNENNKYTLFTDGCFKQIGQKSFASCAGWILDNQTQKIITEFTKVVELNPEKARNMPDFELIGIFEGAKAIKSLGLKNVQCYTDSVGEAQTILSALNGIGERRLNKLSEYYQPIIDIFKETNSSIAWVPRECNTHADALTKIPLNAWLNEYKKEHLENDHIKEFGYTVNREKEIYLHLNNIEIKSHKETNNNISLVTYCKHPKHEFTFIYNHEEDSLKLLNLEIRNLDYINPELDERTIILKRSKPDGANIKHIIKGLEFVKDISNLNVTAPPGVIAVCKKLTPVNPALQEEYFDFHKAVTQFSGKINFVPLEKHIFKKMVKFIDNFFDPKPSKQNIKI